MNQLIKRLELNFLREDGRTARISVPNPAEHLDAETVKDVMDDVIESDIFAPGQSPLAEAVGARVVTTQVTEFDFDEV